MLTSQTIQGERWGMPTSLIPEARELPRGSWVTFTTPLPPPPVAAITILKSGGFGINPIAHLFLGEAARIHYNETTRQIGFSRAPRGSGAHTIKKTAETKVGSHGQLADNGFLKKWGLADDYWQRRYRVEIVYQAETSEGERVDMLVLQLPEPPEPGGLTPSL
jgi:hypothetical protein